jgi:hypothetical protein
VLTRPLKAEQWKVLRRLRSVGCPLDWDHLAAASGPLRAFVSGSAAGTNVFSIPGGTGIVLGVEILASVPVNIIGFALEADWLNTQASWLEPCGEHKGKYCFHSCSLHPTGTRIDQEYVLNNRTSTAKRPHAGKILRGGSMHGLLLATFPEVTSPTAAELLPATLWIGTEFGDSYPFRLLLANKEVAAQPRPAGDEQTQSSQQNDTSASP